MFQFLFRAENKTWNKMNQAQHWYAVSLFSLEIGLFDGFRAEVAVLPKDVAHHLKP